MLSVRKPLAMIQAHNGSKSRVTSPLTSWTRSGPASQVSLLPKTDSVGQGCVLMQGTHQTASIALALAAAGVAGSPTALARLRLSTTTTTAAAMAARTIAPMVMPAIMPALSDLDISSSLLVGNCRLAHMVSATQSD